MILPFGDEALLITLGDVIDPTLNDRAHAMAQGIRAAATERPDGPWGVPVVGYASVLVPYDGATLSAAEATRRLADLLAAIDDGSAVGPGRAPARQMETVEITVRYGGQDGADLEAVAERTGLTPAQVIDAHASTVYRVYLLGFVPGFAYLGIVAPELRLPRRDEPRSRVPRGSVAIAGPQTAVYPAETAGGWHLLGRTDAVLWDMARERPALLSPGQEVRFVPIGER